MLAAFRPHRSWSHGPHAYGGQAVRLLGPAPGPIQEGGVRIALLESELEARLETTASVGWSGFRSTPR